MTLGVGPPSRMPTEECLPEPRERVPVREGAGQGRHPETGGDLHGPPPARPQTSAGDDQTAGPLAVSLRDLGGHDHRPQAPAGLQALQSHQDGESARVYILEASETKSA